MSERKVLITGASKGLGLAMAIRLSTHYKLILHASNESSFKTIVPNSELLCADFSDPAEVAHFCKQLKAKHGNDLYAVINNAGITSDSSIMFQPERDIDRVVQVNLKAPIMICKTAIKIFNQKNIGVIINVGSIVGQTGNAFQAVYSATKAGIVAFSKSLAQEVGALNESHDIRVLSLSPGFIETEMTATIPPQERENYLARIPSKKFGKPEDVANLVSFLLTEQASYINGTNIQINGGLL